MPRASHRPCGQTLHPGDGGIAPSSTTLQSPKALFMLLTTTKEERTLLRKAIIPQYPQPAATTNPRGSHGAGGGSGVPLYPLAWAAGHTAIYFLTNPCPGRVPLGLICCH